MQAFILLGSETDQQDYLDAFQKARNIPSYLITKYDSFKIADARVLQKTLGTRLRDTESRMIIISSPTHDSQNAILKTLEELPERTYVFFLVFSREDILPTVFSRSSLIVLEHTKKFIDDVLEKKLEKIVFVEKSNDLFSLMDILGEVPEDEYLEKVVLSIRHILLNTLSQDTSKVLRLFLLLKTIHENYKLTKSNNVNKKIALEASVLSCSI